MKRILALMLLTAGLLGAQAKSDNQLSPTVRLFEFKHLEGPRRQAVAQFVGNVVKSASVYWDNGPQSFVIVAPNTADQDTAEALLRRFDVAEPPQMKRQSSGQADLTAYLILATSGPPSKAQAMMNPGPSKTRPIPAELQSTIEEMKRSFPSYDRFSLLDVILAQPHDGGEAEQQGLLPMNEYVSVATCNLSYKRGGVSNDSVYLNGFQFEISQGDGQALHSKIRSDVVIHENQKLVLGKIRLSPIDNADLFVILTAKVR